MADTYFVLLMAGLMSDTTKLIKKNFSTAGARLAVREENLFIGQK